MSSDEIFKELYGKLKVDGKSKIIVGIVGYVGSGKTQFAKDFSDFLRQKNIQSIAYPMDVYNSTTRAERNKVIGALSKHHDPNWPRRAYPQNSELIISHLNNLKQGRSFSATLCNPSSKEIDFPVEFNFTNNSIDIKFGNELKKLKNDSFWVLCDGVKLLDFKDHLDYTIFIKCGVETRFNRLLKRNQKLKSPANIRRDLFEDLENNLILDHNLKEENSDIVIDNEDFNNQKIIKL